MENLAIASNDEIVYLPIDKIRPNPYQPRRCFAEAPLEELSRSIKQYGVIQPISVRFINGLSYELVSGERRMKAAKLAGLYLIPCIVVNINDRDSAAIALIENIQREDLHFFEEAEGYKNLMRDFHYTQEDIAYILGKSQSAVANKIRILRLSDEVRKIIMDSGLTERHSRALLKVEDENLQKEILKKVNKFGLNVKRTEELIETTLNNVNENNNNNGIAKTRKDIKIKRYIKDIRIFTNTIKQAVQVMKDSGVETEYCVNQNDGEYEINIKIKK